jgi:hypothetical protein
MYPRGEINGLQERFVKDPDNACTSIKDVTFENNWVAKMVRDDQGVVVNHVWYACGRGGNIFSEWTEDFPFSDVWLDKSITFRWRYLFWWFLLAEPLKHL